MVYAIIVISMRVPSKFITGIHYRTLIIINGIYSYTQQLAILIQSYSICMLLCMLGILHHYIG